MLKFDAYARSDIGKVRTHNEDAYGATEPRDRQPLSQSGSIYVVADGMGGRQLGEKASAFAVETLLKAYYRNPHIPPDKRLREVFLQVNHSLIEYTKDNLQPGERTGTTLLAAVVRGDQFWAASVGDSRLYLVREGGIRKITRDQVQVGSLQKHDSAEQEVRDRLSRIVGSDANLDVDVFPAIPLHRGDILLLCTDGLTRYATSEDILRFAHGHARDIVERLIKFANDCGGSDNITVSVIRVEGHPRMQAGLSPSQVAWIVLGVVVLLSILLLAFIGIVLWKGDPPVPTSTMAPTLAGSPLSPDAISTSPAQAGTQAAPLPGAAVTVTPALTVSPASSLVDCEFTVAEGNTTAGIAERFGAALSQVYRQDGTQQEMNAIRTGEVLVIREISIPACTNGGGLVPLTSTPTP